MLPFTVNTVNSPRSFKGKSNKARPSNTVWCTGILVLVLSALGGLWYLKSHSSHVRSLVAQITEHETKYTHLTGENDKKETEIRRLNRALEAAKADRVAVQGDISFRNTRIEEAETSWRAAAAQLEALTKTHDGVLGQLREAIDRTGLAEQETIEAKMKVAECRREQSQTAPTLESQAAAESQTGVQA